MKQRDSLITVPPTCESPRKVENKLSHLSKRVYLSEGTQNRTSVLLPQWQRVEILRVAKNLLLSILPINWSFQIQMRARAGVGWLTFFAGVYMELTRQGVAILVVPCFFGFELASKH